MAKFCNSICSPLVQAVSQEFISTLILYTFSLQWSNMIFSMSNDGIVCSFDCGLCSVTLTLRERDLLHEMIISSQEILLATWSLLMSRRQHFLNNHLARVLIIPNQERTMDGRDEMLSSVSEKDMDKTGIRCLIRTILNSTGKMISWI